MKSSDTNESIEVVENFEMTNEFKQLVCLPYFKDLHKVSFMNILYNRICLLDQIDPKKASTNQASSMYSFFCNCFNPHSTQMSLESSANDFLRFSISTMTATWTSRNS